MLLIMHYWQHEGLPAEDLKLSRIVRLTPREWQKIKPTISDLFDANWRHKRIELELTRATDIVSKRSAAGKASAEARYNKRSTHVETNAQTDKQQTGRPSPSQPLEVISPPSEAPPNKPKSDDVREAVAIYAQVALREETGWPGVQRLTSARISACRARLAEAGGIEGWRAAMERAARSGFLCGRNEKGWFADFDFFCQSKSFTKLMEGSYDDRAGTSNRGSSGSMDAVLRSLAEIAEEAAGKREREASSDGRPSVDREAAGGGFGKPSPLEIPDYLRRTA
jgi:hypothetical protein